MIAKLCLCLLLAITACATSIPERPNPNIITASWGGPTTEKTRKVPLGRMDIDNEDTDIEINLPQRPLGCEVVGAEVIASHTAWDFFELSFAERYVVHIVRPAMRLINLQFYAYCDPLYPPK